MFEHTNTHTHNDVLRCHIQQLVSVPSNVYNKIWLFLISHVFSASYPSFVNSYFLYSIDSFLFFPIKLCIQINDQTSMQADEWINVPILCSILFAYVLTHLSPECNKVRMEWRLNATRETHRNTEFVTINGNSWRAKLKMVRYELNY